MIDAVRNFAPVGALGDCVVAIDMNALLAAASKKAEERRKKFIPLELNEGNAQAIFNRCLAKENSKETLPSVLFPVINGYSAINNEYMRFDKDAILSNKRAIEYLFGQLREVHCPSGKDRFHIKDFTATYSGRIWSESKNHLLELAYLAVTPGITLMTPFSYRLNNTTSLKSDIKPTLSPKDPNFPDWWEAHKAEWEQ